MTSKSKIIAVVVLVLISFSINTLALAQTNQGSGLVPCGVDSNRNGVVEPGIDANNNGRIDPNEKGEECTLSEIVFLVIRMINFLLAWAWLVSLLFILWAGFGMIGAAGDTEEIQKAKTTLQNAVIGFFLVMSAFLLINFIVGLLFNKISPTSLGPGYLKKLLDIFGKF